jgi:hypothetical protein
MAGARDAQRWPATSISFPVEAAVGAIRRKLVVDGALFFMGIEDELTLISVTILGGVPVIAASVLF